MSENSMNMVPNMLFGRKSALNEGTWPGALENKNFINVNNELYAVLLTEGNPNNETQHIKEEVIVPDIIDDDTGNPNNEKPLIKEEIIVPDIIDDDSAYEKTIMGHSNLKNNVDNFKELKNTFSNSTSFLSCKQMKDKINIDGDNDLQQSNIKIEELETKSEENSNLLNTPVRDTAKVYLVPLYKLYSNKIEKGSQFHNKETLCKEVSECALDINSVRNGDLTVRRSQAPLYKIYPKQIGKGSQSFRDKKILHKEAGEYILDINTVRNGEDLAVRKLQAPLVYKIYRKQIGKRSRSVCNKEIFCHGVSEHTLNKNGIINEENLTVKRSQAVKTYKPIVNKKKVLRVVDHTVQVNENETMSTVNHEIQKSNGEALSVSNCENNTVPFSNHELQESEKEILPVNSNKELLGENSEKKALHAINSKKQIHENKAVSITKHEIQKFEIETLDIDNNQIQFNENERLHFTSNKMQVNDKKALPISNYRGQLCGNKVLSLTSQKLITANGALPIGICKLQISKKTWSLLNSDNLHCDNSAVKPNVKKIGSIDANNDAVSSDEIDLSDTHDDIVSNKVINKRVCTYITGNDGRTMSLFIQLRCVYCGMIKHLYEISIDGLCKKCNKKFLYECKICAVAFSHRLKCFTHVTQMHKKRLYQVPPQPEIQKVSNVKPKELSYESRLTRITPQPEINEVSNVKPKELSYESRLTRITPQPEINEVSNVKPKQLLYESRLSHVPPQPEINEVSNVKPKELSYESRLTRVTLQSEINEVSNVKPKQLIYDSRLLQVSECQKCGDLFNWKWLLSMHVKEYQNDTMLVCKYCPTKETSRCTLKQHIINNHKEEVDMDSLDNIVGAIALEQDRVIAGQRYPWHYKFLYIHCSKCNYKPSIQPYQRHVSIQCPKCHIPYVLQCDLCRTFYTCYKTLRRHVLEEHGDKPYHCPRCDRGFRYTSHLKIHLRACERVGQLYKCPDCPNFRTVIPGCYKIHRIYKHGEKALNERVKKKKKKEKKVMMICDNCDRRFVSRRAMVVHQLVYCGKEPRFQCDYCGWKLYRKDHMVKHLRERHNDDESMRKMRKLHRRQRRK